MADNKKTRHAAIPIDGQGEYQIQIAESGSILYVGRANPGAATSAALWQIKRITEATSGIDIKWADGNDLYDNSWDLVTTLSYS